MSEEQVKAAKAAETDKVEAQMEGAVEEIAEEISEEDLDGVVGGGRFAVGVQAGIARQPEKSIGPIA